MSTATESTTPVAPGKPRKKKRIFFWFFLAVQAVFLFWIFGGGSEAAESIADCTGLKGNKLSSCEAERAGGQIGTGIGVMLIVGLWFVTDFILALTYGIWRLVSLRPQEATV